MHGAPRAVLVVNPLARRGAGAQDAAVQRALAERFAVDVMVPESAAALARAVRRAADAGAAAVIAAGGDGTVRLAACALAGRGVPLGILPAGTANDAARALGVPRSLVDAAAAIAAARPRALDLVAVDPGRDGEGACWLTVGGLGVVTAAAERATALRAGRRAGLSLGRVLGAGVYRAAAAHVLLTREARARRYTVDAVTPQGHAHVETIVAHGAFVANLPYCGGGLRVPGAGAPDDGTFELCFVTAAPRAALALRFARLAAGRSVSPAAVRVVAAREAHVTCDSSDALLGDGERLAAGRAFHLRARPGALQVLV